jgi:hypothetical protein
MGRVTLEWVEYLAMQLPAAEQQKLVARISERLSELGVVDESCSPEIVQCMASPEVIADGLLRELDSIAESISGEFDPGSEIRQIRGGSDQL